MYKHALIIGGTGMLSAASITIAEDTRVITSIARTRRSLTALDSAVSPHVDIHHTLSLDWSAQDAFLHSIEQHLSSTEPPDLVLAWLHDDQLTLSLSSLVNTADSFCLFFHVIGSATTDPSLIAASLREEFESPPNILYHQIILGFNAINGRSRWLTNAEISDGVIDAIKQKQSQFIVGMVEPWSSHP